MKKTTKKAVVFIVLATTLVLPYITLNPASIRASDSAAIGTPVISGSPVPGGQVTISWTSSGISDVIVIWEKVTSDGLRQDTSVPNHTGWISHPELSTITGHQVPNTNSIVWNVPSNLAPGTYDIQVFNYIPNGGGTNAGFPIGKSATFQIQNASTDCANGVEMTGQEYLTAANAGRITTSFSRQNKVMTAHIVNNTNCSLPLSISSYKMFEPLPALSSQQFIASSPVKNIGGNQSGDLSISVANCKTQVDVWYKDAPYRIYTGTNYQNPNIIPYNTASIVTDEDLCTTCASHSAKQCSGNAVYWYDSCGQKQELYQQCSSSQTCSNGSCVDQNISCSSNSDCGTNGLTGSLFCQGNNVYQNYRTYTCNNAGTSASFCSNSTSQQLQTTCSGNQTCSNGSCGGNICTPNYQQRCSGNDLYWFDSCGVQQGIIQYCPNGCSNNACQNSYNAISVQTNSATNVLNNQATLNGYLSAGNSSICNTYVWFQYGVTGNYGNETARQYQNYSGSFNTNIYNLFASNSYHFRAVGQDCSGNTVYGQDMIINSNYGNGTLSATKTVRNLTTGSGWSASAYASPSDMVMFMITLQATGNQNAQNVVVRDNLPSNLTYNNQLVVACTGNYGSNNCSGNNYGYTGNITSGISLGTIYAGQTVTITYQAQIAPPQNFSFGSTTLNNSVYVTSSALNNPTAIASVIVTRSGVLGASTIPTGLTNNFLVDSFLLPLLITLLILWMWRSGMFFWIERFIDNKRKVRRTYKAEKELTAKIAKIRQAGRI